MAVIILMIIITQSLLAARVQKHIYANGSPFYEEIFGAISSATGRESFLNQLESSAKKEVMEQQKSCPSKRKIEVSCALFAPFNNFFRAGNARYRQTKINFAILFLAFCLRLILKNHVVITGR